MTGIDGSGGMLLAVFVLRIFWRIFRRWPLTVAGDLSTYLSTLGGQSWSSCEKTSLYCLYPCGFHWTESSFV